MDDDDVDEKKTPNHRVVECCYTCEHVEHDWGDCKCKKFEGGRYTGAHNLCDAYETDGTTIGRDS